MAGVVVLPPLHSGQAEIARSAVRHRLVICGRRWGKTRLGAVLALEALLRGQQVLWAAPVCAQSDLAFRLILAVVLPVPGVVVSRAHRTISLRGGRIAFRSADREDNLRGIGVDLLVLDEADYLPERVWTEVLRPTLTDRRGRAVVLTTPAVEGGWLHRWFQRAQRGEAQDTAGWHRPSWTSPLLDPGELAAARADLPSIAWRREYGAEWVSAAGARIRADWVVEAEPPPREQFARVVLGVDLAVSLRDTADWTALAVLGREPSGRVWVLEAQRFRAPFSEVLRAIDSVASAWRVDTIAVEDVAYQRVAVQELCRITTHAVRPIRPDRDKTARFAPLEARYEQGLVRHSRSLPSWARDEILAFPVGAHDDLVDALSCAWAVLAHGGSTRSIRL